MFGINFMVFAGNLTADPELKDVNGSKVCKMCVASNYPKRAPAEEEGEEQDTERSDEPDYINIEAWDRLAVNCGKTLKKGSAVVGCGYKKTNSWTNDAGEKRQRDVIRIKRIGPDLSFTAYEKVES